MNEDCIKLWQANGPIRTLANSLIGKKEDTKVFIYAGPDWLNRLAGLWATKYLSILERVHDHLKNQIAYKLDKVDGTVTVACVSVEDGLLSVLEVKCRPTEEGLSVIDLSFEPTRGTWLMVKREGRRTK